MGDLKKSGEAADAMVSADFESDMKVEDRVHIIPLGYERDRVIVPPREMGADKVILVRHSDDAPDDQPEYYPDIYEAFNAAAIEVEDIKCDIFDLYDGIGTIAGLIRNMEDEDVYVNLATGGKVTAIAGMIACMVTSTATPYYVSAEEYGDHLKTPVAQTVNNITNMPTYPIDAPSREQIQILQHIAENGPIAKKNLIEYAERMDLPFIADYDKDEPKGQYRKLDAHIIDPLVDDEYITLREQGRNKVAEVTSEGEKTLHAFKYML